MIEQHQTLGVYFVDQYNFHALCESAEQGDVIALNIAEAIMRFVREAPRPICSMCCEHMSDSEIPDMTIVVMRTDRVLRKRSSKKSDTNRGATLTTWICEECAVRDDLDDQIEQIIRSWPAIPKNSIIDFVKKSTLH
jgi:hypothetical protein